MVVHVHAVTEWSVCLSVCLWSRSSGIRGVWRRSLALISPKAPARSHLFLTEPVSPNLDAGRHLRLLMQPLSLSLSLAEACKAAPDTGPCFGSFQHYFYNSSSMSCELFNYGGCLGNQNNFKNERECLQRCRTEGEEHITCVNQIPEDMDQISQNKGKLLRFSLFAVFFCSISSAVCRLPMSPQPCSGQLPIWAFDSSAGLCVPYKVGICQTNANKFYSKAECEEYCGKTEEDGEIKKSLLWMEEKRKVWDCQSAYLCAVVQKETLSLPFFFFNSFRCRVPGCKLKRGPLAALNF